jgi:hypothetical protein
LKPASGNSPVSGSVSRRTEGPPELDRRQVGHKDLVAYENRVVAVVTASRTRLKNTARYPIVFARSRNASAKNFPIPCADQLVGTLLDDTGQLANLASVAGLDHKAAVADMAAPTREVWLDVEDTKDLTKLLTG